MENDLLKKDELTNKPLDASLQPQAPAAPVVRDPSLPAVPGMNTAEMNAYAAQKGAEKPGGEVQRPVSPEVEAAKVQEEIASLKSKSYEAALSANPTDIVVAGTKGASTYSDAPTHKALGDGYRDSGMNASEWFNLYDSLSAQGIPSETIKSIRGSFESYRANGDAESLAVLQSVARMVAVPTEVKNRYGEDRNGNKVLVGQRFKFGKGSDETRSVVSDLLKKTDAAAALDSGAVRDIVEKSASPITSMKELRDRVSQNETASGLPAETVLDSLMRQEAAQLKDKEKVSDRPDLWLLNAAAKISAYGVRVSDEQAKSEGALGAEIDANMYQLREYYSQFGNPSDLADEKTAKKYYGLMKDEIKNKSWSGIGEDGVYTEATQKSSAPLRPLSDEDRAKIPVVEPDKNGVALGRYADDKVKAALDEKISQLKPTKDAPGDSVKILKDVLGGQKLTAGQRDELLDYTYGAITSAAQAERNLAARQQEISFAKQISTGSLDGGSARLALSQDPGARQAAINNAWTAAVDVNGDGIVDQQEREAALDPNSNVTAASKAGFAEALVNQIYPNATKDQKSALLDRMRSDRIGQSPLDGAANEINALFAEKFSSLAPDLVKERQKSPGGMYEIVSKSQLPPVSPTGNAAEDIRTAKALLTVKSALPEDYVTMGSGDKRETVILSRSEAALTNPDAAKAWSSTRDFVSQALTSTEKAIRDIVDPVIQATQGSVQFAYAGSPYAVKTVDAEAVKKALDDAAIKRTAVSDEVKRASELSGFNKSGAGAGIEYRMSAPVYEATHNSRSSLQTSLTPERLAAGAEKDLEKAADAFIANNTLEKKEKMSAAQLFSSVVDEYFHTGQDKFFIWGEWGTNSDPGMAEKILNKGADQGGSGMAVRIFNRPYDGPAIEAMLNSGDRQTVAKGIAAGLAVVRQTVLDDARAGQIAAATRLMPMYRSGTAGLQRQVEDYFEQNAPTMRVDPGYVASLSPSQKVATLIRTAGSASEASAIYREYNSIIAPAVANEDLRDRMFSSYGFSGQENAKNAESIRAWKKDIDSAMESVMGGREISYDLYLGQGDQNIYTVNNWRQ